MIFFILKKYRETFRLPLFQAPGTQRGNCTSALPHITVGLLIASMSSASLATPDTDQQIDEEIRTYLQARLAEYAEQQGWLNPQISYKSNLLGSSRALAPCSKALQLARMDDGTELLERQRLQLTCPDAANWQIVSLVTPGVVLPVLVATEVTDRGTPLQPQRFELQPQDLSRLPRGFYQDADEISGQVAKRRIRSGQVLTPTLVAPALLVKRGQTVSMIARRGDIVASTTGTALEDGQMGQLIRVRNITSDTVIRAKVKAKGVVASQLP